MMIKKLVLTITLSILATASTFASAATLRFATNTPPDGTVSGKLIKEFAERVGKETDKRVRVRVFWNGSLGSQQEYLQQIQTGIIDFGLVGSATLENIGPAYSVLNMPYLFETVDDYRNVMNSDYVQNTLYSSTEQNGFIAFGYISNGFRSIISTKPVDSLDDLGRLKIRSMDSKTFIESLKIIGVNPIPMNFGDVYPAMQQGIVDGADMNLSAFWDSNYGEIATYGIRTEHVRLTDLIVMSKRMQKKVSPEDLDTIKNIMLDISNKSIDLVKEDQTKSVQLAQDKFDVKIIDINKYELKMKFSDFYKSFEKNPDTAEAYNQIMTILK
ncbi:TRAP transporter substrate-binding protein DctP [Photobacterium sp. ZSDE20]|uniref:TRAP transporter substrate-binding protein DctP n=1 Tax=Photobacterium pectinilyticum TaxID=2906793 RepID=A0ABT1N8T7_9GAMM|nr:TRAP transporter substrate-binding protein DctP [Photobacterium sp. ZSDE20]MCQ1061162.1 TRAP transporter substrate-binding protein DctP [Photobacterium sp. ZSDE20]MDD1829379.1 TRAP transporter substrate-binding protein DctP [Photobacterium sp. ZSDE20]